MATITKSIDVHVPVRTVYNQWTQFESFPEFMDGVKEVRQLDDKQLLWTANIGGKEKQWNAAITEQIPDARVAWHNTSGATNAGVVTFHRLGADETRLTLQLGYDPQGLVENSGDKLGLVSHQVEGDLERFKRFIESRGTATGAWRGAIQGERVEEPARRNM